MSAVVATDAEAEVDVDEEILDTTGLGAEDWIQAGIIVVVGVVVGVAVGRVVGRLVERAAGRSVGRLLGRTTTGAVVGFALVQAMLSLGVRIGPLLGVLGIGGIALAFALQDLVQNLLSSIYLQVRRPFEIGDQIMTNDIEGTVVDVDFRSVRVRTFDGRIVFVPSSLVLQAPMVNRTAEPLRRTTLAVGIDYDTDAARAAELLRDTVADVDGVAAEPGAEVWLEAFGASSQDLAVRFWHSPTIAEEWRVRHEVAVAVKRALDDADIGIPFPQRSVRFVDPLRTGGPDEAASVAAVDGARGGT